MCKRGCHRWFAGFFLSPLRPNQASRAATSSPSAFFIPVHAAEPGGARSARQTVRPCKGAALESGDTSGGWEVLARATRKVKHYAFTPTPRSSDCGGCPAVAGESLPSHAGG